MVSCYPLFAILTAFRVSQLGIQITKHTVKPKRLDRGAKTLYYLLLLAEEAAS